MCAALSSLLGFLAVLLLNAVGVSRAFPAQDPAVGVMAPMLPVSKARVLVAMVLVWMVAARM